MGAGIIQCILSHAVPGKLKDMCNVDNISVRTYSAPRLEALMVEGAKPIESCLVEAKKGEPGAGGAGGVMILRPLCSLCSFVCVSCTDWSCMQVLPASGYQS